MVVVAVMTMSLSGQEGAAIPSHVHGPDSGWTLSRSGQQAAGAGPGPRRAGATLPGMEPQPARQLSPPRSWPCPDLWRRDAHGSSRARFAY